MKVFVDTNIILEYLGNRNYADDAQKVMNAIDNGTIDGYINSCSLGNITYIAEKQLKTIISDKEQRLSVLRRIILEILDKMNIVHQTKQNYKSAIRNSSFSDIEDSYQYQAAIKAKCDYLITINIKDYPRSTSQINIINLQDFVRDIL